MKGYRKFALRLVGAALVLALALPSLSAAAPSGVQTSAEAAALIDVTSGRILVAKNGDKPMRIASLTKIMTAIVAIEHGRLSDQVKVGASAAGKEGSSLYLKAGEEMSLENLLYGLMLRSGNDAATAIAEHVGGSLEGFVYMMNEKAKLIGLRATQFKNPHGLDADGHYSTAEDMAKLTAYALRNPVFRDIVKTKTKTAPNPNADWDYKWTNKNKMLSIYEGADGVKTGYTKTAKRCLVSSATRNGQQLAAVTLNAPNDWLDHTKLLDYGFANYPLTDLVQKGEKLEAMPIVVGQSFPYPLLKEEAGAVRKEAVLLEPGSAAYRLGERGKLVFRLGDQAIGSVPLYAENSPQLAAKEQSTFGYRESDRYDASRFELWRLQLEETVRRLFVLWE
ncbi:D-alanyl-D-alanine carboxypeptidase family protein [Paenibacillus flagellatus]|uniref:D-alanyl-D-alanine carboxypeptidase n=1 Tax=Paenibacillus flagellatus TaxID=2211139 RepID=A0A2V5KA94_9BACL|nr:D-alanyl-D-alanine carboxypeptidase family protein [Paenibacillus flagellatus]PYI54984.1 D-alanyl-D-alanine carboxypeptidase [Paenibacillus flagellatus]